MGMFGSTPPSALAWGDSCQPTAAMAGRATSRGPGGPNARNASCCFLPPGRRRGNSAHLGQGLWMPFLHSFSVGLEGMFQPRFKREHLSQWEQVKLSGRGPATKETLVVQPLTWELLPTGLPVALLPRPAAWPAQVPVSPSTSPGSQSPPGWNLPGPGQGAWA